MPRVGRADVVVGVVAAALFCLVAVAVVTGWPPLAEIDRAGAAWGERNGGAQSWWVPVWTTVSAVFGPLAFRIAAVVALVWMLVSRRRGASRAEASTLFFASATVLLGGIVPVAVKAVVDRPRPEAALVDALHSSFPSAHARLRHHHGGARRPRVRRRVEGDGRRRGRARRAHVRRARRAGRALRQRRDGGGVPRGRLGARRPAAVAAAQRFFRRAGAITVSARGSTRASSRSICSPSSPSRAMRYGPSGSSRWYSASENCW